MALVMLTQLPRYFFVFIGPHTSDEVPDNYVKYLGWTLDWKSSKDSSITQ